MKSIVAREGSASMLTGAPGAPATCTALTFRSCASSCECQHFTLHPWEGMAKLITLVEDARERIAVGACCAVAELGVAHGVRVRRDVGCVHAGVRSLGLTPEPGRLTPVRNSPPPRHRLQPLLLPCQLLATLAEVFARFSAACKDYNVNHMST
jgi:hypothetical protein